VGQKILTNENQMKMRWHSLGINTFWITILGAKCIRGRIIMKQLLMVLALLTATLLAQASDGAGYVCVGGYLFKPNGSKEYVGTSDCKNAIIKGTFACVSGYLYQPNGTKTYVGTSDCETSNLGGGYACVGGYLTKPDGSKEYVGTSECKAARVANGYACIGGYLYKPNSTKEYVGTSDCANANFGD
jgi:hypothetical protein